MLAWSDFDYLYALDPAKWFKWENTPAVELTYTDAVLKTIIPRNTDIRAAHFHRQDIFTYAPQSKSAQAYQRLLVELFPG